MIHKLWKLLYISITINLIIVSSFSYGSSDETNEKLRKLAIANNALGVKLYQELVKGTSGNVFISPFSLSNAFGMLFVGTKGNSAEQLKSVLGYDAANLSSNNVSSAFNLYLSEAFPKNQPIDAVYALHLANQLLLNKDYELNLNYREEVQNQFQATVEEADFSNTDQIVSDVNNWVKNQTRGKIDKLLSELDPETILIILNAIYFNGNWENYFEEYFTKSENYYNHGSDSEIKKVPLMYQSDEFQYASTEDLQALELLYKGGNLSMIILLPKERNGLTNVENMITPEMLRDIQNQMYTTTVLVTLPKFKIEYERSMEADFIALGATDIFGLGADLSGITNTPAYVSQVIHKTAISVDEKGSEAAAATALKIVPMSLRITPRPPPSFIADHPFMFAIMDKRNDMILFLGRVTELE